ncbi:MAG TPA: ferritin-like domain-containing protein, partial [Capsulimonadaceae bacterium]|nr:ferritin-like domain-containing protein [Capsulimonadaceae bacterium]
MPVQKIDPERKIAEGIQDSSLSRRGFLGRASALGLGLAAASILAGCGGSSSSNPIGPSGGAVSETDVLNFALNLEYLEAQFYSFATTGNGLSAADTGGTAAGAVTGGAQVSFSDSELAQIAAQIATDELAHVRLLRSALGAAAVPQPAINLNPLNLTFTSQNVFLTYSRDFEDTGVSAYAGAATLLSGNL